MTTGLSIILFLLAFSLFSGAVTGAEIYFRLASLWAFFLMANWVWARLSLWRLQVNRHTRTTRAEMGQIFEERIILQNPARLKRLWVEMRDESSLPGALGSQVFSNVGGAEERSYISRIRLMQRGVFNLGPTVLQAGDLFGLFPTQRIFAATQSLMVYPNMVRVRRFPEATGLLPGGEALRHRTLQTTPNAAGVREYTAGDPLNRIHWPTTARRERLMVKEFELDPQAEVWIFLDGEADVQAHRPWQARFDVRDLWLSSDFRLPPDTQEYAVSIAASLARYYLEQRRAVGLVTHTGAPLVLPAEQGGRQLQKILENLALWQARGDLPLSGMVEAQARHLMRGSTVVLITPSFRVDVAMAAEALRVRGLRPVVVLLDSASFGGSADGEGLTQRLAALKIPVVRIREGDDLSAALEGAR
ncbi:MAG: DUF58 domain-containing protein [Anaerolineales bacterium]